MEYLISDWSTKNESAVSWAQGRRQMWPNKGNHPSLCLSVRKNDAIYMKHKPQNTDTLLHSLTMWHHCLHEPGQVSTHYSNGVTFIRNYFKLFSHSCIITIKVGFSVLPSLPPFWLNLEMLSMCLLFCFVLFWIFCYVVCEKIKNKNCW